MSNFTQGSFIIVQPGNKGLIIYISRPQSVCLGALHVDFLIFPCALIITEINPEPKAKPALLALNKSKFHSDVQLGGKGRCAPK